MKNTLSIVLILLFTINQCYAQTTISSLNELKNHLNDSNGNFVMTPGTYYFDTDNCGPGKLFPTEGILLFTGSNNTFDFTGVTFEFDTEIFSVYGANSVIKFWNVGSNNIYLNLTMIDIGNNVPTEGALGAQIDGVDNKLEGFNITTRGSFPYGYGDIFGKGGGSVIRHQKHAGILVRGDRNHVKNCDVYMRTYGHGIFMQGSRDALIEGCYVEGELRTIGEVLEETGTGSPADNVNFESVWGYNLNELEHDYTFSLQEDGIRCYTTGNVYGTSNSRNTTDTQIIDCTVVKMRSGITIGWDSGIKHVENCTTLACESGYWVGDDTNVIDCRGDASVGPLYSEGRARSNSTIELTLLDNFIPKIGNTPYFYFAGSNHQLTLHDGTSRFNPNIELQVGGTRQGHRWLAGSGEEPPYMSASELILINETKYPVILGNNTSNSDIFTCASTTDNGSGNSITNLPDCDYERPCINTGEHLEAECFDSMFGIQKQGIGNNNGQSVAYVNADDWISFDNIDFSDVIAVETTASSGTAGGTIEIRQDSTSGTLLAAIPIPNTTHWNSYQTFSADLMQAVNTTTDLYFVFTGGDGYLFNVDMIDFQYAPCTGISYNPFLPISAEDFCFSAGITLQDLSGVNQAVASVNDGDYVVFQNVDFGFDGNYNAVDIFASTVANGGNIEVRSGAVDGPLLTTVEIDSTTSLDDYKVFSNFTGNEIIGVHDIYLVFRGNTGTLLNLDNFHFYNDVCGETVYNAYSEIGALDYCEMDGIIPINDDFAGSLHDQDWIRYGRVDFTSISPTEITFSLSGLNETEGFVNIMLDDPQTGTMIATATVPKTGGWENWQEVTVPINQSVTGFHEIFIYFGGTAYNLDWFRFDNPDCIDIQLNVWLEGAYDPTLGEMTTHLSSSRKLLPGQTPASNLITPTPSGQPYNNSPWNYLGIEGINWTDVDYTGNETDWILVSFRTGMTKNTEVGMTAALLMKDGSIDFPNRCALMSTIADSLYIILEHRNHIGVMTPQPVSIINNTLTHDFRLSDSYRDPTSFGQKQLLTGEWSMYAGDANQLDFPSFDVNGNDKTEWFNNNGTFDYYLSPDFNLDGDVNGQDKSLWFENNGISSRVPK